jgi:predicted ATPase/DNA-binding XRE family transcriptional regulator
MTHTIASAFAELLRQCRIDAGLSQEALAETAGISVNAVSAYERGLRLAPRRKTIASLMDALKLSDERRVEFETVAGARYAAVSTTEVETRHNLPWQPTSFVGRHEEVEEISRLLDRHRLVTVTGSGGIGKTRTSLEVAARLSQVPRDGIWFVDLSSVTDDALVGARLSSTLDLRLPSHDEEVAPLVSALKSRRLLLILDNCEHLLTAIRSLVAAILRECPRISVLATSRERLRIASELEYRLSACPVPKDEPTTPEEARSYDALELFVERASIAKHDFVFSNDEVEAVTDICRKLDGIALAIELAAARLPALGLSGLRAQLDKHFGVIAGAAEYPARHQTLYATITWSHDLLNEPERALFRHVAVFAGSWTLEAAESVCSGDAFTNVSVVDALCSLVEKSLVNVDLDAVPARYSFFESTRAYALEHLSATERFEVSRRHAKWSATFADQAYDKLAITPRMHWEAMIEPEVDNILAALEWSTGPNGDDVLAARIASGLEGFWQTAGLARYGQRCVDESLLRIDAVQHPKLVARLLLAQFRFHNGATNAESMKRAISLLANVGDKPMLARCYGYLSYAYGTLGQSVEAALAIDTALDLLAEGGFRRSPLYVGMLCERGAAYRALCDFGNAKATFEDALSFARSLEDEWSISQCQQLLAYLAFVTGDTRAAIGLMKEAVASGRRVRNANQVFGYAKLALFELSYGETDAAFASAREALRLVNASSPMALAACQAIEVLARIGTMRGSSKQAARLLGYVDAWYESTGVEREAHERENRDLAMERLRGHLGPHEVQELVTQGARMTQEAAIFEALTIA